MPPPNTLAQWLLIAIAAYAGVGIVVGGLSLARLAPRADPALRSTPLRVRFLLLPGVVAVWPFAIARWRRAIGGPR